MLVRYEVDGYLSESEVSADICTRSSPEQSSSQPILADALSSMTVSSIVPRDLSSYSILRTVQDGSRIPQSSIIELKTQSSKKKGSIISLDTRFQLLFGQTSRLYTGTHTDGVFSQVHENMSPPGSEFQNASVQVGLKKLRKALEDIRALAMARGKGVRLSLICHGSSLRVFERSSSTGILPDDVLSRFES